MSSCFQGWLCLSAVHHQRSWLPGLYIRMILPTDMTQPWCDMFKSIYFCQAGRKIAHTPYLRLFQSSFNIEARSSCISQDSGWIFALLHRVGCNTAVILHMFEGCEWLAGGTSREEGSGAHFCATLWSITTAGILLARRQHLQISLPKAYCHPCRVSCVS